MNKFFKRQLCRINQWSIEQNTIKHNKKDNQWRRWKRQLEKYNQVFVCVLWVIQPSSIILDLLQQLQGDHTQQPWCVQKKISATRRERENVPNLFFQVSMSQELLNPKWTFVLYCLHVDIFVSVDNLLINKTKGLKKMHICKRPYSPVRRCWARMFSINQPLFLNPRTQNTEKEKQPVQNLSRNLKQVLILEGRHLQWPTEYEKKV